MTKTTLSYATEVLSGSGVEWGLTNATTASYGLPCRYVNYYPDNSRCDFISVTHDCESESFIDYNAFLYCAFTAKDLPVAVGILIIWTCLLFIALGVAATDFLCPSLFVISESLHLSQNVAGVTLLAFGNGSPDIFAAIAGMRQGRPELVVGALLGGGTFVTSFVIGSIFSFQSFKLLALPFVRDSIFYLSATSWMFYTFMVPHAFHLYDALGFLGLYGVYVSSVMIMKLFDNSPKPPRRESEGHITFEGINPDVDPDADMVVMKGFMFRRDTRLKPRPPTTSGVPGIIPIIKITSAPENRFQVDKVKEESDAVSRKSVSIFEDNSVYSTITSNVYNSYTRRNYLSRASSIFTISQSQLIQIRRASKDFLDKIKPIDKEIWKQRNWGGRGLEIIKAPIRFFLRLTTPAPDLEGNHEWNKPLSVLHCILGPVFVTFAAGYGKTMIYDIVPVCGIVFVVAAVIACVIVFTSTYETPPKYFSTYSSYLGFFVGVTWIYCISDEAVTAIRSIGIAFNLSEIVVGMTILAWGNCLLDFISNLAIARKGFPRMAIAACYGAPLMALLFGVGIPTSIIFLSGQKSIIDMEPSPLIVLIYGGLTVSIIATLIVLTVFRFQVKRKYGYVLVLYYAGIIISAFLQEFGVIHVPEIYNYI